MFGDPHQADHAGEAFKKLKQTSSAVKYAQEFTSLAIDAQYDLNSRQNRNNFFSGLKPEVQNGLAFANWASWDFPTLQRQAVDMDDRLFNVKKANTPVRVITAPAPPSYSRPSSSAPVPATSSHSSSHQAPSYYSKGQGPMDLSATVSAAPAPRGPISQEEKERRRRLGLCHRCATKGHFVSNCPLGQVQSSRLSTGSATSPVASAPGPSAAPAASLYTHIEPAPSESGKE